MKSMRPQRQGFRRFFAFLLAASTMSLNLPAVVEAQTKVVLSNDDGWATANIRALYAALTEEGYNVVLSAPAENGSGSGSLDLLPLLPVITGCEFDSCPAGSPATGHNDSDPRLNYVNSFPATSARLGITDFGPPFFDGTYPDIVLSGPNVGGNTDLINEFSGTVGAASTAALNFNIPAIAISGAFSTQTSYTILSSDPSSSSSTAATLYAQLSLDLLSALLAPGFDNSTNPILPNNTILNVNYPDPSNNDGRCASADAFEFVLTRAVDALPILTPSDVETCGTNRLPTEGSIVGTEDACYASVTVLDALTKLDAGEDTQAVVLQRLDGFLSCAS